MKTKILLKNISFFTFFNVINSAIPFLLLPILTTYLSPEDYGIIDIFYNITLFATPVIGLSIVQSISRYYFEELNLNLFISTVFLILVGTGSILILLSCLFYLIWGDIISDLGIPPLIIVIALLYALFSQIAEIILTLWRVSYKTFRFGIFRIVKTSLDLGLSILLIVVYGMGWEGRIIPQLLLAIIAGGVAIYLLRREGFLKKLRSIKKYRRDALNFSMPIVFHSLGSNLLGFLDRFFILIMLDLTNVGIYSVGYQLGMIVALIQNSFNQAWVPFFFQTLKENREEEKLKIVKFTYLYFAILLIVVLLISSLIPSIYKFFIGKAFNDGKSVVIWILLAYAVQGMYKMIVNYLFYLKETKVIALCTFGVLILNIILNYVLIGEFGILGAAQSTLISYIALLFVIFVFTNKYYPMPWNLKPLRSNN